MCGVTDEFSARLDNGWSQHTPAPLLYLFPRPLPPQQRCPTSFDLNLDQAWWIPRCIAVSDKMIQVFGSTNDQLVKRRFYTLPRNAMLIRKIERNEQPEIVSTIRLIWIINWSVDKICNYREQSIVCIVHLRNFISFLWYSLASIK